MDAEKDERSAASSGELTIDDEQGNCIYCGHPFDPHIIIAHDVEDFSKGGEMRCPVEGCSCFSTVSFNFQDNA